eukprot:COSAG01_NODE_487_length_16389_cov_19.482014_13_plen_95_part_00
MHSEHAKNAWKMQWSGPRKFLAVTSQTARAVWFGQTARRRLGKVQTANRGKSQVWHTPATYGPGKELNLFTGFAVDREAAVDAAQAQPLLDQWG